MIEIKGQFWSTLFVHNKDLYIIDPDSVWGKVVIRKSTDVGKTWTIPKYRTSGLLTNDDLVIIGKKRPIGSQDEAFFHTRYNRPFSVSEWLVAWPTAFRLETLRHLSDWLILQSRE